MFIIIMPRYDDVGEFGYYYFSKFRGAHSNFIHTGKIATKENADEIKNLVKKADTIILSGHGEEYFTFGDDREVFFSAKDADLFKGKVCFFAICKTGEGLGKLIANAGGSFIGFKREFIWNVSTKNPETDIVAERFWKVLISVAKDVLDGVKLEEIRRNAMYYFDLSIKETEALNFKNKESIIKNLIFNKRNFVIYGNVNPIPQKWVYLS